MTDQEVKHKWAPVYRGSARSSFVSQGHKDDVPGGADEAQDAPLRAGQSGLGNLGRRLCGSIKKLRCLDGKAFKSGAKNASRLCLVDNLCCAAVVA